MGSKVKGWHQKNPKKEYKRMSEDNMGRKGKSYDRKDRRGGGGGSKRVEYSHLNDQDSF